MKVKRSMSRTSKIAAMFIGAFSILFVGWLVLAQQKPPEPKTPFQFTQVSRGNLEVIVSSTGTLAAVETVEIGTQISGTIDKLMVDYNDTVKKGNVLAVLDQSLFKVSIQSAKAGLLKAQAELKQAEAEYKRHKPLYEKGYISEQEFLPIETEVDTLKASLLAAKATLQQAEINLEYTVISSPIDGTIIDRSIDAGQTVAASLSTPTLFLIAKDLSHMQIETNVDETDIGQIQQGQSVRFTVQSYFDRTFTGSVRQIRLQPETVDNVVTYTVIVEATNESGRLLPGMTATVDFIVHDVENALLVPVAALQFSPDMAAGKEPANGETDNSQLFCQDNEGRLRALTVDIGPSDGLVAVVTGKNLAEGMRVAIGFEKNSNASAQDSGFSLSRFIGQGMGPGAGPVQGQGPRP
ncbi:MAG: efflux RND transporter periplasmic adaptor subunit [Proteobacteria bacterium]|nr:efflux RND transporter periplasmic adaptor subunit [Pseudomonadota bacterium]MBU1059846.1 efflux RND transporter periplasmic adaptor subunit [Pseudomonadota bacterium]